MTGWHNYYSTWTNVNLITESILIPLYNTGGTFAIDKVKKLFRKLYQNIIVVFLQLLR